MTDPRTARDRTLRRVRGTTATAGLGAVVATGALAAWLGHATTTDTAAESPTTSSSSATSDDDDGTTLTPPTTSPTTDPTPDDRPSVTTGGS